MRTYLMAKKSALQKPDPKKASMHREAENGIE